MNRDQRRKALKMQRLHMKVIGDDIVNRVFMAKRVADLPVPHVPSTKYQCDLCGEDVWIDTLLIPSMKRSKGVHCTVCVADIAGKPADAVFMDQLNEDLGTEI